MSPEKTPRRVLTFPHLTLGLILFAILATGFMFAYWGKVEFDEAFKLQIPVSLALHGKYQTTWQHGEPFDPRITTGPAVLVPIAATFALFGVGILQARLVMLGFFALLSFLLLYISRRLSSNLASLLTLLFFASLPSVFTFGVEVFGMTTWCSCRILPMNG